ncbi:hypothetical protein B0H16DRAFT_1522790 [Mycena metata]|uniref:Uncharacterized protein n=1 Tax=Mycena metata TaxID=1033252 RepID=A0AAD7JMH5_9AGAR|nr:hypothetical protein B0H16DRAFT_1522790 [Mycena metata]
MGGMGAERIRPLSMGVDLDGFLARVRDGPRAAAAAAARAGTSPGAGVGAPHTQSLGVVSSRAAMNMVNGNVPARIHAGTIGHAPPHGAVGVAGIVPRKDSVSPPAAGAAGGPAAAEQAPEEDPLVTQLRAQLAETRSILDQAMSAASNLELRYSSAADVNADTAPAPEETDATHTGTRSLRDELATLRSEVREAQVEEGRRRARARGRGRAGTILADVESASPAPPAADVPPHRPPHLLLHGDQGEGDEDAEDNDDDSEEREKGQRGGAADEQWADDVDFRAEVADMKVPLSPASSAARVERLRGVFDEDDDDLADDSSDGSFLGGLGGGAEADVDAASAEDGEGEQKDGQEDRAVDGVPAARGDEAGASASGLGAEDEAALAARLDIIADQLATLQSRLASMQSAPLAVSAEGTESALDGLDGRVRALEEAVPAESSAPFAITLPSLPSALPSSSPSAVAPSPTDSDSLEVEKLKSSLLSTLASLKIEWETFREETSAFSRPAFLYAPRSDADATVSDDDKADMSDASDSENTKSAPSLLGPTWREDPDDARVPGRWGLLTPAGSVRAMSPARASALAPTWPVPLPLGAFSSPAANGLPAMNDTAPAFVEKHGDETVPAHPVEMVAEDAGKPATKEVKGDPFLLFGAVGAGVAIVAAAWWGA